MTSLTQEITPHLLTTFETLFSVQLPQETSKIKEVLGQLDTRLFSSYTTPHITLITRQMTQGILKNTSGSLDSNSAWAPPSAPGKSVADRDPSPYVFSILLHLVTIHTEVSTTVGSALTSRILRTLFEATTTSLISIFQSLPSVNLQQLMQATLDVEFMAQTLTAYTTERASQVQTDIYQVLDRKTDNGARVRLQEELGELRGVLKRLREGTRVEFGCFRRVRRGGEGGVAGSVAGSVRSARSGR